MGYTNREDELEEGELLVAPETIEHLKSLDGFELLAPCQKDHQPLDQAPLLVNERLEYTYYDPYYLGCTLQLNFNENLRVAAQRGLFEDPEFVSDQDNKTRKQLLQGVQGEVNACKAMAKTLTSMASAYNMSLKFQPFWITGVVVAGLWLMMSACTSASFKFAILGCFKIADFTSDAGFVFLSLNSARWYNAAPKAFLPMRVVAIIHFVLLTPTILYELAALCGDTDKQPYMVVLPVIVLEDLPQLVLTIVYFAVVGALQTDALVYADSLAVASFAISVASLAYNCWRMYSKYRNGPDPRLNSSNGFGF